MPFARLRGNCRSERIQATPKWKTCGDNPMRTKVVVVWAACVFAVLGAARASGAALVDLSKPFKVDKDTIALYHLDDVASGEVTDAVGGGKSGKALQATEADGKFGKAMNGDGTKGWVDFADLPKTQAHLLQCFDPDRPWRHQERGFFAISETCSATK